MKSFYLLPQKYLAHYQGLPHTAWQGIIIGFIESTLIGTCYFLSLYFVNELYLDISQTGLALSCFGLGTIIGGILAGKLCDSFSPKPIFISSLLIQAIAYFFLVHITTFPWLALDLFILGIGSYGFITSNYVRTLKFCKKEERLKAINMLDIVSNLGLATSGMMISIIGTQQLPTLFLLSSMLLCSVAIYFFYLNENISYASHAKSTEDTVPSSINFKIRIYTLSCLFFIGLIISQINSTYPLFLQTSFPQMGTSSFSFLFTLNAILIVLFQAPLVNSLGNTNKILLIGIGAFLLSLGVFLLNFTFFFAIAVLSCLITTGGEIIFFSIAQLICYEKSAENKKGLGLGTYRMVYAGSRIVGPTVGSLIYQQFNSQSLWLICFLIGVLCFMPSLYLKKFNY